MKNETQQQEEGKWLRVSPRGAIIEAVPFDGIMKVSSKSIPGDVAGAICNYLDTSASAVDVQAIGAGAVNQATKAIAIAIGWFAESGISLVCKMFFADLVVNGEERTGIRWTVYVE